MPATFTPVNTSSLSSCHISTPCTDRDPFIADEDEAPADDDIRHSKRRKRAKSYVAKARKRAERAAAAAAATAAAMACASSDLVQMGARDGREAVRGEDSICIQASVSLQNSALADPQSVNLRKRTAPHNAFDSFKVKKVATTSTNVDRETPWPRAKDIECRPATGLANRAESGSRPRPANAAELPRGLETSNLASTGSADSASEHLTTPPLPWSEELQTHTKDSVVSNLDIIPNDADYLLWSDDLLDSTLDLLDFSPSACSKYDLGEINTAQSPLVYTNASTRSGRVTTCVQTSKLTQDLEHARLSHCHPDENSTQQGANSYDFSGALEDDVPDEVLIDMLEDRPELLEPSSPIGEYGPTQAASILDDKGLFAAEKDLDILDAPHFDLSVDPSSSCPYVQISKPIVRPPFPIPTRDRSPVVGLTSDVLLRVCFRIGEALNIGCVAVRSGHHNVIIELYARVVSTSRDYGSGKQTFTLGDLFHDRPPLLNAVYEGWKGVSPWDYDSAVFLEEAVGQTRHRMCRCMGRMRREREEWLLTITSIWEAGWEDVEHVRGIICA